MEHFLHGQVITMVKVSYRSIRQWQRQGSKVFFYKNECSLLFEKVMEILSKSFSTLDKDPDKRYSECQKVEKYFSVFRCQTWKWWHRSCNRVTVCK
jgi:hypothetical protein